jgi:hypothetical protein
MSSYVADDALELLAHVSRDGLDVLHDYLAKLGTFAIEVPQGRLSARQPQCGLRQSHVGSVANVQLRDPRALPVSTDAALTLEPCGFP